MPQSHTRQRQRIAIAGGLATSLVCAMLIWAKLRLVTDIPRTAIAEPSAAAPSPTPAHDADTVAVDGHANASHAGAAQAVDSQGDPR